MRAAGGNGTATVIPRSVHVSGVQLRLEQVIAKQDGDGLLPRASSMARVQLYFFCLIWNFCHCAARRNIHKILHLLFLSGGLSRSCGLPDAHSAGKGTEVQEGHRFVAPA